MDRTTRQTWEHDLRALYSPQEIQTVLRRERCRADRSKRDLAMVVLQLEEGGKRQLERLARLLLSRARSTDEAGWFAAEQLCAVLPDTGSVGACRFAQSMCELARQNSLGISCSIYTYPTPPSDGSGSQPLRDDRQRGFLPNALVPRPENGGKTDVGTARRYLLEEAARGMRAEMLQGGTRILPLEELLVRPLPFWKRVMDILGAAVGTALSAPIVGLAAALIKLTSPGPVVFRQQRTGLAGKPFWIYKLRTMVMNAEQQQPALRACSEQDGPAFKMSSDPRVTPIGRFLRMASIDELPQFLNVLRGEMSLVGPRPLPVAESDACEQWQRKRLDVHPGLTCIWQVRGRSRVTFDEWIRMDMEYIGRRTPWHDLKLMLMTVVVVILRRGAH